MADADREIECLKLSNEEKVKQLEAKVVKSEAKSASLELKIAEEKAINGKLMVKLSQLETLLADLAKTQEAKQAEITSSEAEVYRLRAECANPSVINPQQLVALDRSIDDMIDEVPIKKRKKMRHECSNCGYTTFKAYSMKVHRQEGCRSAEVNRNFSCVVCKAEFTYNRYRYHLNQYTKQSSHAKNSHQNYSPAQHRQMLEELKKTKQ